MPHSPFIRYLQMIKKLQLLLTVLTLSTACTCFTSCGDEDDNHIVVSPNSSIAVSGEVSNDSTGGIIVMGSVGSSLNAYQVGIQLATNQDFTTGFQEIHTTAKSNRTFTVKLSALAPNTTYYYRSCVHINAKQSYIGKARIIITDSKGAVDEDKTYAVNPKDNKPSQSDEEDKPNTDTPQGDDPSNLNANVVRDDETVSRIEIPYIDSKYDYICHKLSNGDVNYSLLYSREKMHSVWVAYTYDSKNAQRNWTSRTDAWSGEPYYDSLKDYQLSTGTFGGGYARGHLCGSAERYYSKEANEQTFYMSNMSPMISNFNSIYWGEIEDKARDNWGRSITSANSSFYQGTLYLVKGGTIDKEENILEYRSLKTTNNKSVKVAVPKYYWMACLFISKDGSARAIGFWLEHKDYKDNSDAALKNLRRSAACSIDDLEKKTGIDFFCNLKDNAEDYVESTYDISLWPGI